MRTVVPAGMARRLAKRGVEVVKTTAVPDANGSFAAASIAYVINQRVDGHTSVFQQRIVSPSELWRLAEY